MFLEPYSQPRDVTYVIVAPDNEYVLQQAAQLFRELSVMYEQCLLGKHLPLADKLQNGVMRIGRATAGSVMQTGDVTADTWFQDIGILFSLIPFIVIFYYLLYFIYSYLRYFIFSYYISVFHLLTLCCFHMIKC